MGRIKTATFSHPCPIPDCPGEVKLEYETGKGREDFQLWQEEFSCDRGHALSQEWADSCWEQDCEEMGERAFEAMEEARQAWIDRKIDEARGK